MPILRNGFWIRRLLSAGAAIAALLASDFSSASELPPELRRHGVGTLSVLNGAVLPRVAIAPFSMSINDSSNSYVLDLAPKGTGRRTARHIGADGVREKALDSKLFVGKVRGDNSSRATVVIVGNSVVAVIRLGSGEEIWAEPMSRFDKEAAPGELLTYRRSDIDSELVAEGAPCGFSGFESTAQNTRTLRAQDAAAPSAVPRFIADGEVSRLKVAVVGEFEFTEEFATAQEAEDDLNALMELVGEIFMPELGLTIQADVDVVTNPADPYFPIVSTSTRSQILSMVGAYRVGEGHIGLGYGVTHLAKNTPAADGVVGVTNTTICNASGGGTFWNARLGTTMFRRTVVTAHELGHNCGAQHDDDASNCPGTLFETGGAGPTNQNVMTTYPDYIDLSAFSTCSRIAVRNRIGTSPNSCLTPVTCGDVNGNGVIQSNDGLSALSLATGGPYNGLADVLPGGTMPYTIQTNDALAILQMAVGSQTPPADCGQPHCVCGDGVTHCHEECDDGNTSSGDGCTQYCQTE